MGISLRKYIETRPVVTVIESRLRKRSDFLIYVEGVDDLRFYSLWLGGNPATQKFTDENGRRLFLRRMRHKSDVLKKFLETYNPMAIENFASFVVDLDFDRILERTIHEVPVYYQMFDNSCDLAGAPPYNDLECFVVNTEAYLKFMKSKGYGKQEAKSIRNRISLVACVLGAFRVANIKVREAHEGLFRHDSSILCTEVDGRHLKLSVDFALESGIMDIASLELDIDRFSETVRDIFSEGTYGEYVGDVVNFAEMLFERFSKAPFFLSRGHDVMEILALKLMNDGRLDIHDMDEECEISIPDMGASIFTDMLPYMDFSEAEDYPVARVLRTFSVRA